MGVFPRSEQPSSKSRTKNRVRPPLKCGLQKRGNQNQNPVITFTVPGIAQPKGSTAAYLRRGRLAVKGDNAKAAPWQKAIAWTAREAIGPGAALTGPIVISVRFYFSRPKSARGREYPIVKPDLDKLLRCACDALTGVVYADDCQVMRILAAKYYGTPARAEFVIWEMNSEVPDA